MKKTVVQTAVKTPLASPIKITNPEPWQWRVLAKAFIQDPVIKFWFDEKLSKSTLELFFEAIIKGTLESGGAVFSMPDHKVILVWYLETNGPDLPDKWKQQIYKALGPEGVKRYQWVHQAANVPIDPVKLKNTMQPIYIGVLPEVQKRGYGKHIMKWTINYLYEHGYNINSILASSRRSAKLYKQLGFDVNREISLDDKDEELVAVVMNWKGKEDQLIV